MTDYVATVWEPISGDGPMRHTALAAVPALVVAVTLSACSSGPESKAGAAGTATASSAVPSTAVPSTASPSTATTSPANRYDAAFLRPVLLSAGDLGSGFNLTDVPRASDDQQHMGLGEMEVTITDQIACQSIGDVTKGVVPSGTLSSAAETLKNGDHIVNTSVTSQDGGAAAVAVGNIRDALTACHGSFGYKDPVNHDVPQMNVRMQGTVDSHFGDDSVAFKYQMYDATGDYIGAEMAVVRVGHVLLVIDDNGDDPTSTITKAVDKLTKAMATA
jgi:hypothetical protein